MIGILLLQEHATLYEKLVFDAISYMLSEDRDDDVAVELHSKVSGFSRSLSVLFKSHQFEGQFDLKR